MVDIIIQGLKWKEPTNLLTTSFEMCIRKRNKRFLGDTNQNVRRGSNDPLNDDFGERNRNLREHDKKLPPYTIMILNRIEKMDISGSINW